MKCFCYGSFANILEICAIKSVNQFELNNILLSSVEEYDYRRDNSLSSKLFNCKRELSPITVKAAKEAETDKIKTYFQEKVMCKLDPNKINLCINALKDIINSDENIHGDTTVDLVNGLTKDDLLCHEVIDASSFLSGIFLYAIRVAKNKYDKDSIEKITEEYINSFKKNGNSSRTYSIDNTTFNDKVHTDISKLNTEDNKKRKRTIHEAYLEDEGIIKFSDTDDEEFNIFDSERMYYDIKYDKKGGIISMKLKQEK